MVQLPISLIRGSDGQVVEAMLLNLAQNHVADFESFWRDQLQQFSQEDKYWDWAFKQRLAITNANHECYAVACQGQTQGLMMLETQWHRSLFYSGQRLVYIEALSTAPWNRQRALQPPRFKAVGTALLVFSRLRSLELGYEGRVGLHALPGAESFYESKNMIRLDADPDDLIDPEEEQLTYFEYPHFHQDER